MPFANGAGRARQHQERGLKGILGLMLVAEQATADAAHQVAVPVDQRLERGLFMSQGETLEQAAVGHRVRHRPRHQPAYLLDDRAKVSLCRSSALHAPRYPV